jgi:tetratricopeptide (TPR) repeat protein
VNLEHPTIEERECRKNWLLGLLLAVVVAVAYLPVWHAGFIWDDDRHITRPELQTTHGLVRIWTELGATQQYYPLVHSVFWVEHKLWGESPLGYHLVNVVLHLFSALLLATLLRRLKIPGAWLAAALFALHPVEVESVAWVSELKNTLSGLFYLLAALAYLGFDQKRNWKNYAAAFALFGFGLMSKTVVASLPAGLLVVFWWQRGKLSWKRDVLPLLPFFVAGLAAGLLTAWVERKLIHAEGAEFDFSIIGRSLIAGRAIWFYLGKLAWPADLSFIYARWRVNPVVWWQYVYPAAALLLFGALAGLRSRWRGPLAAFLFFGGTLFPALGFFNVYPFRYSFVADHFQYLAGIGPLTLAAAGIAIATRPLKMGKWVLGAVLLLLYAGLTLFQCGFYSDAETLWRATFKRDPESIIARNNLASALLVKNELGEAVSLCQSVLAEHPDNATAKFNLGFAMLKEGRLDEAFACFQRALVLQPNSPMADYHLGEISLKRGQFEVAVLYFDKVIELQPDSSEGYCNLGYALLQNGRRPEAAAAYEQALALNPRYALAHNDLGNILLQSGRAGEAMVHFTQAAEILPDFAEAHFNMAGIYQTRGQLDAAVSQYEIALKLRPDLAGAHFKLGMIFVQQGRLAEAVSQYDAALKIQPDLAGACNNLAWLLATASDPALRNGPRAVELARRAMRLTRGKNPVVCATMAAACAESGQFNEAVKAIDQALAIASNNVSLAGALQKQKSLYQAGSPFREPGAKISGPP